MELGHKIVELSSSGSGHKYGFKMVFFCLYRINGFRKSRISICPLPPGETIPLYSSKPFLDYGIVLM